MTAVEATTARTVNRMTHVFLTGDDGAGVMAFRSGRPTRQEPA